MKPRLTILAWLVLLSLTGCITNQPVNFTPGIEILAATQAAVATADTGAIIEATSIAQQVGATQTIQALELTAQAQAAMSTGTAAAVGTQAAVGAAQTGMALQGTAIFLQQQAEQQRIEFQRQEILNRVMGWAIVLLIIAFLGVGSWAFWQFTRAELYRRNNPDRPAQPYVVWNRGRRVEVDPQRPFFPFHVVETTFANQPIAPDTSTAATMPVPPTGGPTMVNPVAGPRTEIPAAANWRTIEEDWRGGALPIGMSHAGLVSVNFDTDPHLMLAGSPGSGKTRFGLRTLIATALADGWSVVIYDRDGQPFDVFRQHPNARLALIPQTSPGDLVVHMQRISMEVARRGRELERNGVTEWEGMHPDVGPRLLVVVDGYEAISRDMATYFDRDDLWRYTRAALSGGQRAGVHMALVFQDPLYGEIDLRMRRFLSPVVFPVQDRDVSRLLLNREGAELLSSRQFMAILNGELIYGLGFAPDEEQIQALIEDHPQPPLPAPLFL